MYNRKVNTESFKSLCKILVRYIFWISIIKKKKGRDFKFLSYLSWSLNFILKNTSYFGIHCLIWPLSSVIISKNRLKIVKYKKKGLMKKKWWVN